MSTNQPTPTTVASEQQIGATHHCQTCGGEVYPIHECTCLSQPEGGEKCNHVFVTDTNFHSVCSKCGLFELSFVKAQLDAARAELKETHERAAKNYSEANRYLVTFTAVTRENIELVAECDELRQKLAEAEKAVLLSIQNYKEAIHERDRLHHDALGYLAKYTCTPEEGYLKAPQCLSQDIDRVGTERDSLRAQVGTLKGALMPFARAAGQFLGADSVAMVARLTVGYCDSGINLGHLRSAKSAMEGANGTTDVVAPKPDA